MRFRMVMSSVSMVVLVYSLFAWSRHAQQTALFPVNVRQQQPYVTVLQPTRPTIELAFVLDTTGSMTGMIDAAKQKIWCIVNQVMKADCHPKVRVGLVAYRDHGDVYVTKVTKLTDDLDSAYAQLMQYRADGGGDRPEDVRQALSDGVHQVGWSTPHAGLAQVMFLVGDSPPHNDYINEPDCLQSASDAAQAGITINAIECGSAEDTKQSWQAIASRGQGKFLAIAQDGGAQTVATPYDTEISRLGSSMGGTYLPYGGSETAAGGAGFRAARRQTVVLMETEVKAGVPASVTADRAYNKAINSDAYAQDLILDVEDGRVSLDKIKPGDLPDDLLKLSPESRKAEVDRRLAERNALKAKIVDLAKKRDVYIEDQQKRLPGGPDGFDSVIKNALKSQLAAKGIKI